MSNPLNNPQALGLKVELIDEGLYALLFQTGAVDLTFYMDGPALDALIEKLNRERSRDIDNLVSEVDAEELKLLGDLPAGTLRLEIPPLGVPEPEYVTKKGTVLTESDLYDLAQEAEAGYDMEPPEGK